MLKGKPHFDKHHRIAVIGAGPAGIHMASLLKKNGYCNVTVLEKSARIGGKSYTQFVNGVPYELGTCFMHNGYRRIKDLLRSYGLRREITPGSPAIYLEENLDSLKSISLSEYLANVLRQNWKDKHPKWHWAPKGIIKLELLKAIWNYCRLYRKLFGTTKLSYAIPLHMTSQLREQIDMTFLEFLKLNQLEALIGLLQILQTAQGYGRIETIPAYYGLCWMTPEFLSGIVRQIVGFPQVIRMVPDGFETLWRTIALKDELSVELKTKIHSIKRQIGNKILIDLTNSAGIRKIEAYDFLILTINLRQALQMLENATEIEKRLFSALKSFTLTCTLYESEPIPGYSNAGFDLARAYFPDALASDRDNEWYADRNDRSVFAKFYNLEQHFDRQVRLAFQFSEQELLDQDLEENGFAQDIKARDQLKASWVKAGLKDPVMISQFSWPYFTHFPGWAIREGYTNELFESQGHGQTWYAGASACFESVNHVVNYNHALMDTYL
uniref:Protoporphyrinogen oxidase-like protein n=1 Tax=Cyanothece sp. (strain PCC 7425 / ATCC 29141) TaxID=395961 RepID=B8HL00_CYAP4